MKLRTRITVIVIAAFVVMVGTLIAEGLLGSRIANRRLADALVTGDRNAWNGVIGSESQWLEFITRDLASDQALVQAVGADDPDAVGTVVAERRLELDRIAERADGLRIGVALFGGAESEVIIGNSSVVTPDMLGLVARGEPVNGLMRGAGDRLFAVAAAPVYTRAGLAGLVAVASALAPLLDEYANAADASVRIQPRTGPLDDSLSLIAGPAGETFATVELGLRGLTGAPLASLLTRRDVSEEQRRLRLLRLASYGAVASAFLLLLGVLQWYMRRSFRPLDGVIALLNALARGRRVRRFVPAPGNDEIARLSHAAAAFRGNLEALDAARLAQSRMEGELSAAASIQRDLVPPTDVPLALHPDLDIVAAMQPAKEVGGDLFDVFMLDADRAFFLIGDVSDKGMPSALFMAIVRTLFKARARALQPDLALLMSEANRYLCDNNPSGMFVTAFAGVVDTRAGDVMYCDGGHDPPFVVRSDGLVEAIEKEGGLALGIFEDFAYRASGFALSPGDALVLYTDGLTEAMNAASEPFTTERIRQVLESLPRATDARAVTGALVDAAASFAGEAERSDDLTVLTIRRHNAPG